MAQLSKNMDHKIPHLVFYDDACPLCLKEINHYRRLETLEPIKWIPIHQDYKTVDNYGFNKQILLERLHVVRNDGVIVTGASAFTTIWFSIKRYHYLGKIVYKLNLIPLLETLYKYFVNWRIKHKRCEV